MTIASLTIPSAARLVLLGSALLAVPAAQAQAPEPTRPAPRPRANPFACLGEGESLSRGMTTAEMEAEIAKRLTYPFQPESPGPEAQVERARHLCVTAELMRRVGDVRAPDYYAQAVAADPGEPGMELWYGYYMRNVRGPHHAMVEEAELHHHAALDKLRTLREQNAALDFDDTTEAWVRRGLMNLYQEDGLPLLRSKAFPYARNGARAIGASVTAMLRASADTNEFGSIDDSRRYAAEAQFAGSPQRLNRPLDQQELRGIVRTPFRYGLFSRLRLRLPWVGALDASYEYFRAPDSQIGAFTEPNRFTSVAVDSFSVGWKRTFDLHPVLDLLLDVAYRRVERTGVVEWYPLLKEGVNLLELRPAVARFFGPDKLLVGMNYVYMDIPTVPGGAITDRVRARAIRAFYADYAVYRQLLLPDPSTWELRRRPTRGLHFYGGYAMDDEAFGVRVAYRRDAYGGIALRGIGAFDVTVQGTVLASDTTEDRRGPGGSVVRVLDGAQVIRHARPTLVLLYRIVDEEAIPDVPRTPLAGLNLVVPIRADFAYEGTDAFDNVRGGAELWSKLISTGLRGTNFLVTAGYEAQWFHRLSRVIHMGRVELRMGWGRL
jgi:hypothetical protein